MNTRRPDTHSTRRQVPPRTSLAFLPMSVPERTAARRTSPWGIKKQAEERRKEGHKSGGRARAATDTAAALACVRARARTVARWQTQKSWTMRGLCVPLPQPGGPTRIVRDGARERQKMRRSSSARMAWQREKVARGEA